MAKQTLRVLGTSVTLLEEIRREAARDLDLDIEFRVLDGVDCQQQGVIAPEAYDVYDQWFNSVDLLWTAGAIQPIRLERIARWGSVGDLTRTGKVNERARPGVGARPVDLLYVQADGSLGNVPTDEISMLPTAHNVDSFCYDAALAEELSPGEEESWAWLLDERWRGATALLDDPAIGIADAALAAEAAGLLAFEDIGNMSIEEIDALVSLLVERKRSAHFSHLWSGIADSVALMRRRKSRISTIWSPALFELMAGGRAVVGAAPKEGYRGWHSGLALSVAASGDTLDAAYRYLEWWLDGKAGALVARQGYYMSVQETTRAHLSEAEWAFWYAGEAAAEDLLDPHGNTVVSRGAVRDGGSYEERVSDIAVWSTLMDEHNYLVRRWNDFLEA